MKHILQGLETLDKKTEQRKLLWKRLSKLETQKLFQVGVDDRKKSPQVWEIKYFFFLRLPPFILQAECQNHIRIVAKLSKEVLLVCGTHAYKPKCRHYAFKVSTSGSRKGACLPCRQQEFSNCRFLHFAILTKIEAFRTRDGCSCEILKEKRSQSFYVSRNVK